jgi:hypothetical protein
MCAAHVYRLIEGAGEGHLMTTVMVPHVLQASWIAEPSILKLVADRLRESLGEADDGASRELLARVDRDRERRRRWRRHGGLMRWN